MQGVRMHGDKKGSTMLLGQFHPPIQRHEMVTGARHGHAIPPGGQKLLAQFGCRCFRNIFLISPRIANSTGVFPAVAGVQHDERQGRTRLPHNGGRMQGLRASLVRCSCGQRRHSQHGHGQHPTGHKTRASDQKPPPVQRRAGRLRRKKSGGADGPPGHQKKPAVFSDSGVMARLTLLLLGQFCPQIMSKQCQDQRETKQSY